MPKLKHKLDLPRTVLSPLLNYLKSRGHVCIPDEPLSYSVMKAGSETIIHIKVRKYTIRVSTDDFQSIMSPLEAWVTCEPIKGLIYGNFDTKLQDRLLNDVSFYEAVKRLESIWEVKGVPLVGEPEVSQELLFDPKEYSRFLQYLDSQGYRSVEKLTVTDIIKRESEAHLVARITSHNNRLLISSDDKTFWKVVDAWGTAP